MTSDSIRLAQILLVASDQSYAGNLIKPVVGQPGVALAVFQDGPPQTNFEPPYSVGRASRVRCLSRASTHSMTRLEG